MDAQAASVSELAVAARTGGVGFVAPCVGPTAIVVDEAVIAICENKRLMCIVKEFVALG